MTKLLNRLKTFISTLYIRKNELSDYINFFFNQSKIPEKNFVIFANYRTGSTLLADLLNCHPDIFCDNEIFLKFSKSRFKKVIFPYLYTKSQSIKVNKKVYGFDLKIDQLNKVIFHKLNYKPEDYLLKLHQNNWKIIYLYRENLLNQILSNIKANSRKQWHDTSEKKLKRELVYIDMNTLIKEMKRAKSWAIQEKEIMKKYLILN